MKALVWLLWSVVGSDRSKRVASFLTTPAAMPTRSRTKGPLAKAAREPQFRNAATGAAGS